MGSKWSHLERALGGKDLIEPGVFDALSGFRGLPFPRPAHLGAEQPWRIAVKVIDPRGNEGRNDHLEFNIPYELYGEPHAYEPDFIVRLSNGVRCAPTTLRCRR